MLVEIMWRPSAVVSDSAQSLGGRLHIHLNTIFELE